MELKRDLQKRKIYLIENGKTVLETGYFGADFFISLSIKSPIIISKELDQFLYMNLKKILESEYIFDNHGLSYKQNNKIVWLSDQYCDVEDENQTNMINRLIIEQINDDIKISFENPFLEKNGINRSENVIAFSPCGNGFYSKNINTGLSFQDDIVIVFYKTLKCECIDDNNIKILVKQKID